mmetsp:Transcript_4725/g.17737  ORF Transcript_4725/g.17737 Transcript_4725/m.17737 type:complete len:373 (+) Transcript_4725:1810-2928(+)
MQLSNNPFRSHCNTTSTLTTMTSTSPATRLYHNTHFPKIHDSIRSLFTSWAKPERAKLMRQYFAPFPHVKHHGVITPDIDKYIVPSIFKKVDEWDWEENDESDESTGMVPSLRTDVRTMNFLLFLMRSAYAEEKRAAVGCMKHIVIKRGKTKGAWIHRLTEEADESEDTIADSVLQWMRTIEQDVLKEKIIADWASCDNVCGIIGMVLAKDFDKREEAMDIVKKWRFGGVPQRDSSEDESQLSTKDMDAERNLWLQRMACVSLLKSAKDKANHDDILQIVEEVIKNQERFAQLGAGWVVREVSVVDEPRVLKFLKRTHSHWIREGWRYAIEKLDKKTRQKMLKFSPGEDDEQEQREEPAKKRRRIQKADQEA